MSKKGTLLYCFSPPVMLLTFVTEIALALYTIWRYRMTTVSKLAVGMLTFLATFQLSEYMLCGGLGLQGVDWMRFGYVSITLLPPIGLHMATVLAGKEKQLKWLVASAYGTAVVFVYFFIFVARSLNGMNCMPNYAVFHVDQNLTNYYGAYYYGWLLVSTHLALKWAKTHKHARNLRALAMGYAVFIIPTTLAVVINPQTTEGIPSIMCGFAILMALIVSGAVLPGVALLKNGKRSRSHNFLPFLGR